MNRRQQKPLTIITLQETTSNDKINNIALCLRILKHVCFDFKQSITRSLDSVTLLS